MSEIDFNTMTIAEIDAFASVHCDELGTHVSAGNISYGLQNRTAALERRSFGFAVVLLDERDPHLWLVYIVPELRGRGLGQAFIHELLTQHAAARPMTVNCSGERRRRFFARCGFVVEADGAGYRMTTNKERRPS